MYFPEAIKPYYPMSIRSATILFLLFPLFVQAQLDRFKNKKDIIWAAKVDVAVNFDSPLQAAPEQLLEAVPVKAIQEDPLAPAPRPFTHTLNRLIEQGAFPAFADKAMEQPLSHSEAMARMVASDTVVVFDPETYEEKIHIVKQELLGKTPVFITHQLWMYNGRSNEIESAALAFAPAVDNKEPLGEYEPLVWFRLPPPKKKLFNLRARAVPFATYLDYNLSGKDMETVMGKEASLQEILIEKLKSGEVMGYDSHGKPLSPAGAMDIFVHQDTIITFDPETYEEHVQVVRMEFGPVDIGDFRVRQSWFFAPQHNALQCLTHAVAPAVPVVDEYGARLSLRPLFFWRRE